VSLRGFVEELHKRHALSQSAIAKTAGLSQGAIYKILAGMGNPEIQTYRRLAAAFPELWRDYLKRHPTFQTQLRDDFSWSHPEDRLNPVAQGPTTQPRYQRYLERLSIQLNELPKSRRVRYEKELQQFVARLLKEVEKFCAPIDQAPHASAGRNRTRRTNPAVRKGQRQQ